MKRLLPVLLALALVYCAALSTSSAQEAKEEAVFSVHPIGTVKKMDGKTTLVLKEKYAPGLLGLDGFSHVIVFYWFDKNDTPMKRSILQVHPRGNRANPLTGVFATRAPVRPNLIAMTVCKIVSVKDNVVEIDNIDAFPDTPILDLKPYTPKDSVPSATVPAWARRGPKAK
ncbi:MAG: tRNA (N6-threonylcarbamoyladenosine(37)-N6)-methyltransferase TrmO [Planctomycetes bacterium]|nr:tRNA (N6-threonylcarbamoyladenosine(37)-N6)-methyltransferase TrmO [Planctomycetota bacterium]